MKNIKSITIYNNEVSTGDRYVRYVITLCTDDNSVQYEDLLHDIPPKKLVNHKKFDELFLFAVKELLACLSRTKWNGCSDSAEKYHAWRKTIKVHEDDILWRINVHFEDGSLSTAIFEDMGYCTPIELDRMEHRIRRALGMRYDKQLC